ncbi:MAG: glycoside hydrolase family 3 C-terminal domain-containing protein, partial [Clostridia bacterium]|nr:glycoside hydrolase family 3 C-terminal domain-containing protein [Clostridia bacterium]
KMTLEQKASLTSGKDFWQSMNIDELGIPSMFLPDGPHGIRKQAAAADHLGLNASIPATCYPTAATMANTWNPKLGEEMATCLGEEAVALKVNVLLGPGTNMKRNPRCGRNFEYFAEDPYLAGKMASAYIRGIQSNGISACVKHFALNNQEERRMVIDTIVDERTMREIYLTAFEMSIKEGGAKSIMSSYNMVNGKHANENMHLMQDILRDEWGFEDVVVTDWAGENLRVPGLIAGNELEMPGTNGDTNLDIERAVRKYNEYKKAVEEGAMSEEAFNEACEKGEIVAESVLDENIDRLLNLIFSTEEVYKNREEVTEGTYEPASDMHDAKEKHKVLFDELKNHAMALRAAQESVVLLKNENNILLLSKETKVALIGDFAKVPRYQGAGSSVVNPTRLDTAYESLAECGVNSIGYAQGFDRYGKKKPALVKEACELAAQADVALVYVGLDEVTEAEGLDREDIELPACQIELIEALAKTGTPIVAVLSCGSAIEMNWDENCAAVVHAYLGGQAGAKAVLDVVMGTVNPSGKLSETYPLHYEDCSSASHFPGKQVSVEYREGPFIGYRYFDTADVPVKYPFGFGLSYTTFEYSDLTVDEKGATFTITNTGSVDGAEVAQVYVGKKDTDIIRPKKELKGFTKVFLKAGESKTVTVPFDDKAFRYYNVDTLNWEIEGGEYQVYVAASVADVKLEGAIKQEGTGAKSPYDKEKLPSYFSGKVADVSTEEFEALLQTGDEKVRYNRPNPNYPFYKKNRMVIHPNCTVADLKYSKRWVGRLFSGVITFAINFMRAIGNRTMANTLIMGVYHQPMRGMAKFGGFGMYRANGLITMFNGHFFKGLGMFLSGDPQTKAEKKAKAKAEAEAKAAAEAEKNKD